MQQALYLDTAEGRFFLQPQEILRLEASSNYTKIYFTNRHQLVCAKVLKAFVPVLEPFGFIRTHRTHLVNRRYIQHISRQGDIIMSDASVAEISRRMKTNVMKQLAAVA